MAIRIGAYSFDGPYASTAQLVDRAGVHVILTLSWANQYQVVDVGESATVRSRIENHDRKSCWKSNVNRVVLRGTLHA